MVAKTRPLVTARGRAWCAVIGPVQFTLTWLVLGMVSDGYTLWGEWIEYSPISQPISGLGMGATAGVMNASFVLLGVLLIVGSSGVSAGLPGLTGRARTTSAILLGLVGVGAIVDGVFNLESILMHSLGFALVISTIFGFPIVGRALRRTPLWRSLGRWLVAAGPVTLVLAIWYFASFDPTAAGEGEGIAGVTQRLLVTWILAWYIVLGWRVATRPEVGRSLDARPSVGPVSR
jgi:hypothetical protein